MGRSRGRRMALLAVLGSLVLANLTIVPVRALGFLFIVDTKGDQVDANLLDNTCETVGGNCSLRAAIMQANAVDPGTASHEIRVEGSVFMSRENTAGDENVAAEGDYDIRYNTRIVGIGSAAEIVAGNAVGDGIDRIFDIRGNNIHVEITNIDLRFGDANGGPGGAIRATNGTQELVLDGVLIENSATSNAGVAIWSRADLEITDSVIRNNQGRNGTIYTDFANVTIRRTTISGNTTTFNGSALYAQGESVATIDRSTISGNTSGTGGPIVVGSSNLDDSSLLLRNSTMSGNTATIATGAMIHSFAESVVTIESSTIGSNTGFGLDLDGPSSIKNTILAGNSRGSCAQEPTSAGHNLDAGTSCGFDASGDLSPGSAQFGPLQDNGGPTKTRALKPESDAIDAGAGCPSVDQRGNSRPKDGDGDGVAACDIGAYEHGTVAVVPTPTPEVTEAPTAEPTAAPTAEPTPADTAPPSAAPSGVPAASAPPSETGAPGATGGGQAPSPAASGAPAPADSGDLLGSNLWLVLAVILAVLLLVLFFVLRRRRPEGPGRSAGRPGG